VRNDTVIHEAGAQDLASVGSVLLAANREFEAAIPAAFFRPYLAEVLDIRSRLRDAQVLVAEHNGRIVGTITLYPDASREGWGWPSNWTGIRAVAVEPSVRGLGIGRRLAQACIDHSRALGAEAACLHTASFMRTAAAMYERLGFRRAPEFDRDAAELFAAGAVEPPIAALAYRLDLREEEL
jgi:predicted N-acetyltransferase YhbS